MVLGELEEEEEQEVLSKRGGETSMFFATAANARMHSNATSGFRDARKAPKLSTSATTCGHPKLKSIPSTSPFNSEKICTAAAATSCGLFPHSWTTSGRSSGHVDILCASLPCKIEAARNIGP